MYKIIGKDGDSEYFDALVVFMDTPKISTNFHENLRHILECYSITVINRKVVAKKYIEPNKIQSFYAHSMITPCLEDCPEYLVKNLKKSLDKNPKGAYIS